MGKSLDESYQLLAARTMLERLQALSAEIEGVRRADDIENIHRMRVASRRMRAGFQIFSDVFTGKIAKRWKNEIKQVTHALGTARDADVQIEYVQQFLTNVDQQRYRPGVERLLLRLNQHRASLQESVIQAMDRLEQSSVIEQMLNQWRQQQVKARLEQVPEHSQFMYDKAYAATMLNLEQMLVFESVIDQPEQVEQHHDMRIRAKKLRYTMEVFTNLYDHELKNALRQVKKVQAFLGDIHDCDVWITELPMFIEHERQRTEAFFGHTRGFKRIEEGLQYMIDIRRQQRETLFKDFCSYWHQLNERQAWSKLRSVLAHRLAKDHPHFLAKPAKDQKADKNKPETQPAVIDCEPVVKVKLPTTATTPLAAAELAGNAC